jgi:hypothetical protein
VRATPPSLISLTFSIKQTGVPAGGAIAGALVPALILAFGWRASAIAIGVGCLALALAIEPWRARLRLWPESERRGFDPGDPGADPARAARRAAAPDGGYVVHLRRRADHAGDDTSSPSSWTGSRLTSCSRAS